MGKASRRRKQKRQDTNAVHNFRMVHSSPFTVDFNGESMPVKLYDEGKELTPEEYANIVRRISQLHDPYAVASSIGYTLPDGQNKINNG